MQSPYPLTLAMTNDYECAYQSRKYKADDDDDDDVYDGIDDGDSREIKTDNIDDWCIDISVP